MKKVSIVDQMLSYAGITVANCPETYIKASVLMTELYNWLVNLEEKGLVDAQLLSTERLIRLTWCAGKNELNGELSLVKEKGVLLEYYDKENKKSCQNVFYRDRDCDSKFIHQSTASVNGFYSGKRFPERMMIKKL